MRSLVLSLLLVSSFMVRAQSPDSVRVFIDSALNIMQQHSMFTKNVDWKTVRDSAHALSRNSVTYRDAVPAVQYAFNQLGDKHGWVVLNDTEYHNPKFPVDTGRVSPAMKEGALKYGGKIFSKRMGDYAYINIPFFGGQTAAQMNNFAQRVQDSFCKAAFLNTTGVILDLPLNAGGNVFPMLIGVSNILGNGVVSQTKDGNGAVASNTTITEYSITLFDTILVKLQKNCGDFTKTPVAVLIGPVTGSSGEALTIAFSSRPHTILIGEATAGYTTGNNGFLLPGFNNGIVIGEDYMTDKNGKGFTNGITPAVVVSGGDNYGDWQKDLKIKAALKWLKAQHKK